MPALRFATQPQLFCVTGLMLLATTTGGMTLLAIAPALATALPPTAGSSPTPPNAETAQASGIDLVMIPLKPGDRIRINVIGFPDFSGEQIIPADGNIQLPLAGSVNLAGMGPSQASAAISTALQPYIRRPQVAFSVVALSALRINVTGEVLQPGPRNLEPTKVQNTNTGIRTQTLSAVTVSDALAISGGITPNADLRNIVVRRRAMVRLPGSPTPVLSDQELKVNLWDVIKTGDLGADLQLFQGDEVIIPKAASPDPLDRKTLLSSTLAPNRIRVQVAGEVQKPGQVDMAANAGLIQAIAAAGGPTREAKNSDVLLYRATPEGRLEAQKYAFGQEAGALQDGDVVVVGRQKGAKFLETLGRILNPLSPLIFLLKP